MEIICQDKNGWAFIHTVYPLQEGQVLRVNLGGEDKVIAHNENLTLTLDTMEILGFDSAETPDAGTEE